MHIIMPFIDCWPMTQVAARDCLAQAQDVRLLLIDNGSGDEARAECQRWVTGHLPTAQSWHHRPPFPSLAGTWNRALQMVWETGGTHALVVNNDLRLHPKTYEALLRAQRATGGWCISACNVGERWGEVEGLPILPWDEDFLASRGGPDFSCFLITKECHRWFQFDEGFVPAYHEDNDYHRRLQLAGFGDRIFSLPIPYLHFGSATINRTPEIAQAFHAKFAACQAYYRQKWGGLPGQETYEIPFNNPVAAGGTVWSERPALLMLGQGKVELALAEYQRAKVELFNDRR